MKGLALKLPPAGLLLLVALIPSCLFGFTKILDSRLDYHKYASYFEPGPDSRSPTDVVVKDFDGVPGPDLLGVDVYWRTGEERSGLLLFRSAGDLTYQPPVYHEFAEFAYGLGCADIDADGDQDAASALRYSNHVVVCVNDGSGNFVDASYPVGASPVDAMLVDVDGVNGPDLITANSAANSITCRYNNGAGVFLTGTDFSVGVCPVHVIACDMDRDGRQDIITANRNDGTVSVLLNNGQGGFAEHAEYETGLLAPFNLASGDFDAANGPDVVVVEVDPYGNHHQIAVLFNDGVGHLDNPVLYPAHQHEHAVAVADLDGDGDDDIIAANQGGDSLELLYNNGSGSFVIDGQPWGKSPLALFPADLDGDQFPDLVSLGSFNAAVALNNRSGRLQYGDEYTVGVWPQATATGDLNGDLMPDVAVANFRDENVSVLMSDGHGGLEPRTDYGMVLPRALSLGDLDGVNGLDIATSAGLNWVEYRLNDGTGHFTVMRTAYIPDHMVPQFSLVDVDGDADQDIVALYCIQSGQGESGPPEHVETPSVYGYVDERVTRDVLRLDDPSPTGIAVLLNNGSGRFGEPEYYTGPFGIQQDIVAADIDADGAPDICTSLGEAGQLCLYHNDGTGAYPTYTLMAAGTEPYALAAGHLNHDDLIDIVAGEYEGDECEDGVSVLLNNGQGGLTPSGRYRTDVGIIYPGIADVDGDFDNDIVTANGASHNGTVLLNTGNGSFAEPYFAYGVSRSPKGRPSLADIDADGDPDFLNDGMPNQLVVSLNRLNHQAPSSDSEMTHPNWGRKLVRDPSTNMLHVAYTGDGTVFYEQSSDGGATWSSPEPIGTGTSPAIVLPEAAGGQPWVVYLTSNGSVVRAIRSDATCAPTWDIVTIFQSTGSARAGAPSLAADVSLIVLANAGVTYPVYLGSPPTQSCIYYSFFTQFSISPPEVVDGPQVDYGYGASIAATPGSYVHVAWIRGQSTYYSQRSNSVWSLPFQISRSAWPPTEAASNPSVEAYGDSVFCVWRGPNDNGGFPGDIWRRAHWLWDPVNDWPNPSNQSQSPDRESDFPVMTTSFATVWHEQVSQDNTDIWGRFLLGSGPQLFFQTPMQSRYPHVDGCWDPGVMQFHCNTAWTEQLSQVPPLYAIGFGVHDYVPTLGKGLGPGPYEDYEPALFYVAELGRPEQSPYCTSRGGYAEFGSWRADTSATGLTYQLPYLDPRRSYKLCAILYHEGDSTWDAQVRCDSGPWHRVRVESGVPDTFWLQVPKALYKRDARIIAEVVRVTGGYVSLAELKLFQIEEQTGEDGGVQSVGYGGTFVTRLRNCAPNPFAKSTSINYELACTGSVALTVHDVSGRLVRHLESGPRTAGRHDVRWDGNDGRGHAVPAGVYFVRLSAGGKVSTGRLTLVR